MKPAWSVFCSPPVLWTLMQVPIPLSGDDHPNYLDPAAVIAGFLWHLFYTVPLAL